MDDKLKTEIMNFKVTSEQRARWRKVFAHGEISQILRKHLDAIAAKREAKK